MRSVELTPATCLVLQSAFIGAMAIADLVKSTLGPKGMVGRSSLVLSLLHNIHRHVQGQCAFTPTGHE